VNKRTLGVAQTVRWDTTDVPIFIKMLPVDWFEQRQPPLSTYSLNSN